MGNQVTTFFSSFNIIEISVVLSNQLEVEVVRNNYMNISENYTSINLYFIIFPKTNTSNLLY